MLYVDALATDPAHRRRGVATRAARRGRPDGRAPPGSTASRSTPGSRTARARALYERAGFTPSVGCARRPTSAPRARVGGSGFVGYVKRRARRLSASATRATWPSVICGKNGSASERPRRPRRPGTRPGGGRSARGRTTSGGSPGRYGLDWTPSSRSATTVASRSTPRGQLDDEDEPAAHGRRRRPRTAARGPSTQPASASRYQPATRARAASMSSSRSSWASPSAQAMSERR